MSKEKLFQIYEEMANLTLSNFNEIRESEASLGEEDISKAFSVLNFYRDVINL